MVDQAHSKENEAKETIQRLKSEINNLTKLVEQSAGMSMGQEHKYAVISLVILYTNENRISTVHSVYLVKVKVKVKVKVIV